MYYQAKEALVEDVVRSAAAVTEKQGYSEASRRKDRTVHRMLSQFSQERYGGKYSIEIGEAFMQAVAQREPPLSAASFRTYVTTVERLNHVLENDPDWLPPLHPTMEYTKSRFTKELLDYNEYLKNSGKTVTDIRSRMHIVARFLNCADRHGATTLQEMKPPHIYAAFQEATDKGGFRKSILSFLQYAFRHGLVSEDFSAVVPAVARHTPVPSVYTPEEVEALLASIDRTGQTGRRNYAIVMIAARLGLRSCDIAAMQFDNIHFDQETIEIIQIKTKEPLILPLLPDVRAALVDYVENERTACDSNVVFLNRPEQRGGRMPPHGIYTIPRLSHRQYPIASGDAFDPIARQRTDGIGEALQDGGKRREQEVGESRGADFAPDLFHGVHFRRAGGQVDDRHVVRNDFGVFVPRRAVADKYNEVVGVSLRDFS